MLFFSILLLVLAPAVFGNDENSVHHLNDISGLSVCLNQNSIHFVNNPESCQAYWLCANGSVSLGQCPFGSYFNEKDQLCDTPRNVRCRDQNCPPRIGYIPRIGSCSSYQLCVQGIVVEDLLCPKGSHFDQNLGQCNFPELVQCFRDVCPKQTDPFDFVVQPSPDDCGKYVSIQSGFYFFNSFFYHEVCLYCSSRFDAGITFATITYR